MNRRELERAGALADENELRLAEAARGKLKRGLTLTTAERNVLRRVEQRLAEDEFRGVAEHCPQHLLIGLLGIPRKTVLEWERAGLPRNKDQRKTYDLYKVFPWLRERLARGDDESPAIRLQRLRGDKIQAELAVMRRELVLLEEVQKHGAALVASAQSRLLGLPRGLAGRLAGCGAKEIERELDDAVRGALRDLAEMYRAGEVV